MNATKESDAVSEYDEIPLPFGIVHTPRKRVICRFESRNFAQVSLDAIANKLGAYRDCLEIKFIPRSQEKQ